MLKVFVFALIIVAVLIAIACAGLSVQPKPFAMPLSSAADPEFVAIPTGLPPPVERFYRARFGERIPVVETAVFTGRCRIRPFGIWLPARFVFVHRAGTDYRHFFEATFFGLPFMKVNEGYVDGASFFESPMGTILDDANTNQGANLALWAEAGWFPSVWVTDSRVRWEGVDDRTALLFVPFEDTTENFVVRFDPRSGFIDTMEAMRYREPGEGKPKILWITRNEKVADASGRRILASGSATWLDQGKPWAVFGIEAAAYNADVADYLRKRGY